MALTSSAARLRMRAHAPTCRHNPAFDPELEVDNPMGADAAVTVMPPGVGQLAKGQAAAPHSFTAAEARLARSMPSQPLQLFPMEPLETGPVGQQQEEEASALAAAVAAAQGGFEEVPLDEAQQGAATAASDAQAMLALLEARRQELLAAQRAQQAVAPAQHAPLQTRFALPTSPAASTQLAAAFSEPRPQHSDPMSAQPTPTPPYPHNQFRAAAPAPAALPATGPSVQLQQLLASLAAAQQAQQGDQAQ